MNELSGMHAFCHYGYEGDPDRDRFGRIFNDLPPLNTPPDELRSLGKPEGPMEQREDADRTDTVSVGQIFFGQFIDHDITLDTSTSLSSVAEAGQVSNVRTPTLDLDNIYGLGPEADPFLYHGEGLGPVGAQIVAETLYGLIELDDRSYLASNRNWDPDEGADGVGPTSLGELLTFGQPDEIP